MRCWIKVYSDFEVNEKNFKVYKDYKIKVCRAWFEKIFPDGVYYHDIKKKDLSKITKAIKEVYEKKGYDPVLIIDKEGLL